MIAEQVAVVVSVLVVVEGSWELPNSCCCWMIDKDITQLRVVVLVVDGDGTSPTVRLEMYEL